MEAAILFGSGNVVRTHNFVDLRFNFEGYLYAFECNGVFYNHCSLADFPANETQRAEGFYCVQDWLEYWANKRKIEDIRKIETFEPVQKGDTVVVKKNKVEEPYTVFNKLVVYSFEWDKTETYIGSLNYIKIPASAIGSATEELLTVNMNGFSFYDTNVGLINNPVFADKKQAVATYLTKTALVISHINMFVFNMFTEPDNQAIINSQNLEWAFNAFDNPTNIEILHQFYENLFNFYKVAFINKEKIRTASGTEKLYWLISGMSVTAITPLSAETKLTLLNHLSAKLSTVTEKEKEEELCVKIALSFDITNLNSIDAFLEGLIDIAKYPKYDSGKTITLYQYLYDRMSTSWNITEGFINITNWVFNTDYKPTKTKGAFVQALYALWQFSKYSPYNVDGSLKNKVIGYKVLVPNTSSFTNVNAPENQDCLFYYSHTVAYSAAIDPVAVSHGETEPFYTYNEQWPDAAPMVIPYESEKAVGIFFDNFIFKIENNKIKAYQSLTVYKIVSSMGMTAGGKGSNDVLYGSYEFYQPVSLLNAEVETKVPVYSITGDNLNVNGLTINSFIPIFVLEYIDSAGDRSDAETMIGYAADIILTFTAIGNVTKIRHLRWAATGAETIGLFTMEGLTIVIDTVTLTSQVLNYISLFVECDSNNEFCKAFKKFSNALSIACLTVNAGRFVGIAAYAVGKQCSRLISIAGGGSSEAIIRANLKAKLLENNVGATEEVLNGTTGAIHKLNLAYGFVDPITVFTFAAYKTALYVYENIKNFRIKQQLNLYRVIPDTPVNVPSLFSDIPRFSLYKYEKVVVQGREMYKNTGQFVHTESQFVEMAKYGIEDLKFSRDLATDFILKSYRTAKPKSYTEVMQQMDGFKVFSTTRNFLPFCFTDATHFTNFKNYFNTLITKYNLNSYLSEYQVSGSAITQATGAISDLDLVGFMLSGKLKSVYLESGEIFIKNMDKIKSSMILKDSRYGISKFDAIKKYYQPLIDAQGDAIKVKAIKIDQISAKHLFRIENGRAINMGDELFQVKNMPGIKPNVESKKMMDFNIFIQGGNGRRIHPDLTIKIN